MGTLVQVAWEREFGAGSLNGVAQARTRFAGRKLASVVSFGRDGPAAYVLELAVVGITYFILAKVGLALILPSPSAPVWPAAGFALATVLLRGYGVWPAIFIAAWVAGAPVSMPNAGLTGWIATSAATAIAATLEALVGGYLINVWADGRRTFDSISGIGIFAALSCGLSAIIGATVGVASLCVAGYSAWENIVDLWIAWWLRDLAGALVVTPVVVLWAMSNLRALTRQTHLASAIVYVATIVVGVMIFTPLIEQSTMRTALSVLAALPLLGAAIWCGSRDTATSGLILTCFALWGALAGTGPLAMTPNGSVLPLVAFVISTSVLALALAAEIAGRQELEFNLRHQVDDFRSIIFSQTTVGIVKADTTGQFTLVNDAFCQLIERSAEQLLQLRLQDLIDADDLSEILNLLGRAIHLGEGFVSEVKYVLPAGSCILVRTHVAPVVDIDGKVHQLAVVAEDITARCLAEQDLRGSRDNLQTVLDDRTATLRKANEVLQMEVEHRKKVEVALKHNIAERCKLQEALIESDWRFRMFAQGVADYAIYVLDSEGRIKHWNIGAQRLYQYTAAEIVGEHFSRFYTEEERQRGEPARALQVAAYEGKDIVEGQRVRRDESLFWASIAIEAVRDEVGTLVGFVQITRDIAERREAQTSLERAQEQLAQSQKMEALGQLTGSIAHDFNNLLTIVSGYAQLLRRRLTDAKHLQAIDAVHSAASRGESLTRQLLAFSRRQPLHPVIADLKQRIEAVHEMLVGSLRGNVQLSYDIAADVWPVEVDLAELELALINVAVNARDAMPGGGIITLSARNVTLKKSDLVDRLEGDFVTLSMTDTGVGIAPDILPKIFEPFFTTKALGKGTGLGLSQVYGFARQSGGTVVATSAVGSGTTITIYLPRKHAAIATIVEAPPTSYARPAEGVVLVVEDNADVAAVTASLIEQLGYRTICAADASDALNTLQQRDRVDLIFSDVVMPGGMNGLALAQEVHNRHPEIPVLLTSGYNDVVQTAESRFPVLRKPFQLPALEKAIRDALEQGGTRHRREGVLEFPRSRNAAVGI